MRIACLQFAPVRANVIENIDRVNKVIKEANTQDIDLMVFPEMAFTGNNFKSLQHISSCLEQTGAGITSAWARYTALEHDCVVVVGYPEKVDSTEISHFKYYNSAITIGRDGEIVSNYRKLLLDDLDKSWALEGSDGFSVNEIPTLGNVTIGIGRDLNFEASLTAYEFAHHILINNVNIALISMAWPSENPSVGIEPEKPDWDALILWAARLEPLTRAEDHGEIIVVISNRHGVEEEVVFAGTSCVLSIGGGEIKLYGVLGCAEQALLVVDTSCPPKFKLVNKINVDSLEGRMATLRRDMPALSTEIGSLHESAPYLNSNSMTTSISSSPISLGSEEVIQKTVESAPMTQKVTQKDTQSDRTPSSAFSEESSPGEFSDSSDGLPLVRKPFVALERSLSRPHSAEW